MLTLQITDFNHRQAKIRTRVGGLYHPILHLHPTDMVALGIKCGGSILVCGSSSLVRKGTTPQKLKEGKGLTTTIVAVAWPQNGAQRGQARLSRLLRRCLTHGQQSDVDGILKYVHVSPTEHSSPSTIMHDASPPPPPSSSSPPLPIAPIAREITISMSATTREHLAATHGRTDGTVGFPSHLESYFAQALLGRYVSSGTGFSCPVFGISHTFWISGVTLISLQGKRADKGVGAMAGHAIKVTRGGESKVGTALLSSPRLPSPSPSPSSSSSSSSPSSSLYARVGRNTSIRITQDSKQDASNMKRGENQAESKGEKESSSERGGGGQRGGGQRGVTTFDHIGGLAPQIKTVRDMLQKPLHTPEIFLRLGLRPPKGVLLFGPPGTGKTMIARAVSNVLKATFLFINGSELLTDVVGESEVKLRGVFRAAERAAPSVIFIDEIDALCPRRDRSNDDVDKRMVSTLLTLMDGVSGSIIDDMSGNVSGEGSSSSGERCGEDDVSIRVVVLAATNRPNALDPALRRPGRFDREVEIGIPTETGRFDILNKMLANIPKKLTREDLLACASKAHGFVGADLKAVVQSAGLAALKRSLAAAATASPTSSLSLLSSFSPEEHLVGIDDLMLALGRSRPSAMREVAVEIPKVRWSDIGGQNDVKERLKEAVEWPLSRPELFVSMGIRPPKGVLLYGPPGCSKTLMAKAVATESGMNFLAVKGPELFNKWVFSLLVVIFFFFFFFLSKINKKCFLIVFSIFYEIFVSLLSPSFFLFLQLSQHQICRSLRESCF